MDIVYYRREDSNVPANESGDPFVIGPDYIKTYPNIAITYLIVIILATISGTVGNILVIGAVVINKVRLLVYFHCENCQPCQDLNTSRLMSNHISFLKFVMVKHT